MFRRSTHWAAPLLLMTFLAGCESGTTPPVQQEIDTQAALADFASMEQALGADELAGFQALAGRASFGSSPAAVEAIAALRAPSASDGGRAFAQSLAESFVDALSYEASSTEGPLAGPIISGWNRGVTFVYDPTIDEYAPDLSRTDAPETGVRFVAYEVDDAGVPILGEETGYVDLIDQGDSSQDDIVLLLRVVHHEATVLEYGITLNRLTDGVDLDLAGFLFGDDVRLDFAIGVAARENAESPSLDIDFDFGVANRGFSISGEVHGVEDGDDGSVMVTVRHRQDSIEVSMTGTDGILDGTVKLNGALFATVTGPEDSPTFTGSTGEPLTADELHVLLRIVDTLEDVFDFLEDLVDPVDELLLLGFIL